MRTAVALVAEAQGASELTFLCWGSVAAVVFWLWYSSKRAREKSEQLAAEQQLQQQAFAAEMQRAWAVQQAQREAEDAVRRERRAAHDRAVAEFMTRIAQGTRLASPTIVAMLPMKKNEEPFYTTFARARGARGDSESGHLIVTNQRVHWNYANDQRKDVLKTWRGIARWYHEGGEKLVIEWGSGTPLVLLFNVPEGGAEHDARLACELMNRARAASKE